MKISNKKAFLLAILLLAGSVSLIDCTGGTSEKAQVVEDTVRHDRIEAESQDKAVSNVDTVGMAKKDSTKMKKDSTKMKKIK